MTLRVNSNDFLCTRALKENYQAKDDSAWRSRVKRKLSYSSATRKTRRWFSAKSDGGMVL